LSGTAVGSITYQQATGFVGAANGIKLGAGGAIQVANDTSNNLTPTSRQVTWEFLFGVGGNPANGNFIVCKGNDNAANPGGFGIDTDAAHNFNIFATNNGLIWQSTTAPTLDATVRHYMIVRNGTSNTIYINGTSIQTGSDGGGGTVGSSTGPYILGGAWLQGTGVTATYLNAVVACFALYPTALSSGRVTAHYNALTSLGGGGTITKSPPPGIVGRIPGGPKPHKPPPPHPGPTPQPPPPPAPQPGKPELIEGERLKDQNGQ
jgi:hypothetical protein